MGSRVDEKRRGPNGILICRIETRFQGGCGKYMLMAGRLAEDQAAKCRFVIKPHNLDWLCWINGWFSIDTLECHMIRPINGFRICTVEGQQRTSVVSENDDMERNESI